MMQLPPIMQRLARNHFLWLCVFMWVGCSTAVASDNHQRALLQSVEHFLFSAIQQQTNESSAAAELMIEVTPPSAHFGACINPQPFFPGQTPQLAGRVQVAVRCGSQGEQVRYLQAFITVVGEYVVASHNLTAGTILRASDVRLTSGNISNQRQPVFTRVEDVVGLQVRRNIRAEQTLLAAMLQTPHLIERNDTVVVVAEGAGFRVQREGVAMDSGGIGDEIRVRISNREVLRAFVIGPGQAAVYP